VLKQVRRGPHSGSESLVLRLSEAFPFPLRGALALLCGALSFLLLPGGAFSLLLDSAPSLEFGGPLSL
jgi:hypothetical protein